MPDNTSSGRVPESTAQQYRSNWQQILTSNQAPDTAFRYLQDGKIKTVSTFELAPLDISSVLDTAVTALHIYPAAVSTDLQTVTSIPVFAPMIRAIRQQDAKSKADISDYYQLFATAVSPSPGLPALGLEHPQRQMTEITPAQRAELRANWSNLTDSSQIRAAFYNRKQQQLQFHYFASQEAARIEADHLRRLIELVVSAGEQARFLLHLGYRTVPEEDQETFGFHSVLEVRDRNGESLNFDDPDFCPPWCEPKEDEK